MALNLMPMINKAASKSKAKPKKNWIAGATENKGGLHRSLGVPQGQKIPESKIEKAEGSSNPRIAKQARLAETLKGFKKG